MFCNFVFLFKKKKVLFEGGSECARSKQKMKRLTLFIRIEENENETRQTRKQININKKQLNYKTKLIICHRLNGTLRKGYFVSNEQDTNIMFVSPSPLLPR